MVEVRCRQHSSITEVQFNFGGKGYQSSNELSVDQSLSEALTVSVQATDNQNVKWTITLEPLNFLWQSTPVNVNSAYLNG